MAINDSFFYWDEENLLSVYAQVIHIVLGYSGLVFNSFIIYVSMTQKGPTLLGFLAVVDMTLNLDELTGSPRMIVSMVRTREGKPNMLDYKIPRFICLGTPTFIFGSICHIYTQSITVMIAVERLIAALKPTWWQDHWENIESQYISIGLLVPALPLLPLYGTYILNPTVPVKPTCAVKDNAAFSSFISYGKLLTSTFAFIATIVAVSRGTAEIHDTSEERAEKFKDLNRMAVVVSTVNFMLVTIPYGLDILRDLNVLYFSPSEVSALGTLAIANSTINLPCLLLSSSVFRNKCKRAIKGCGLTHRDPLPKPKSQRSRGRRIAVIEKTFRSSSTY